MGESIWVMPEVGPLLLYIATVIMSAGTFLAVLGYIWWHDRPAKRLQIQHAGKSENTYIVRMTWHQ